MAVKHKRSRLEVELKRAIVKVVRGDLAQNEARKALIARAATAQLDIIPANWAEDGSLMDGRSGWGTLEERETWSDVYVALGDAVDDLIADMDGLYYGWVQDLTRATNTTGTVIFQSGGSYYSADYDLDPAGPVTLGDPKKVRPVTNYIPTERAASDSCDLCSGNGKIRGGSTKCPDCGGSGKRSTTMPGRRKLTEDRGLERERQLEIRRKGAEALSTSKVFEHREFAASGMEIREADDDGMLHFTGYASVTETPYCVGSFTETICRGAFKRTLGSQPDVVFLINHKDLPLARTARAGIPGNLTLEEDYRGLLVDASFYPEDQRAQDLAMRMRNSLVDQMSFAFRVSPGGDVWNADWSDRKVKACELNGGDVSAVTFGANSVSTASMRSQQLLSLAHLAGDDLVNALMEWRSGGELSPGTVEMLASLASSPTHLATLMGPMTMEPRAIARVDLIVPDYTNRARLQLAALEVRS